MDKIINKEGRILVKKIKEKEQTTLNRNYEKEERWTYIREIGISTIDYAIVNNKTINEIEIVEERNRTKSNRMSFEI